MAVQVTTTTLFTTPTPSHAGSQVHSLPSISIGAIVGGTIAGSALAVLVVVIWIYWGKQIQKTKRKQEEELDKNRKTRYNTLRNAQISRPKIHDYCSPSRPPPRDDKRVKFAGEEKALTSQPHFESRGTVPLRPAWLPNFSIRPTGSWSLPLNKLSQNSIHSTHSAHNDTHDNEAHNNNDAQDSSSQPISSAVSEETERPIPHKASNVSTLSNASGESRLGRVPSSLILAALGGNTRSQDSLHTEDRQSNASFWNHLFRAVPGISHPDHSENGDSEDDFPVGAAV